MTHVTHDQAHAALCDPRVSPDDALRLFVRAYRRSNLATKAFTLRWTLAIRQARDDEAEAARWADDGGALPLSPD